VTGKHRKYYNKPTEVDGIRFDSKKEATRYLQLKLLQRAGKITNLRTQVPYQFEINGSTLRSIKGRAVKYVADFVYEEKGEEVVEDVKSAITSVNPLYLLKKALMKHVHGIDIRET